MRDLQSGQGEGAAHRAWGDWAFERRAWEETAEADAFAGQALNRLFRSQFSRSGKVSWLQEAQALPARAAYVHVWTGNPPKALETLESGRAQLMREVLERNRRDLERLAEWQQYVGPEVPITPPAPASRRTPTLPPPNPVDLGDVCAGRRGKRTDP